MIRERERQPRKIDWEDNNPYLTADRGLLQAYQLGKEIAEHFPTVECLLVSPFQRTVQTAYQIVKAFKDSDKKLPLFCIEPGFSETPLSVPSLSPADVVRQLNADKETGIALHAAYSPIFTMEQIQERAKKWESYDGHQERLRQTLTRVCERGQLSVLIVGHAATVAEGLRVATGRYNSFHVSECSLSAVVRQPSSKGPKEASFTPLPDRFCDTRFLTKARIPFGSCWY